MIDLKQIIEQHQLDTNLLASVLFPDNKHPVLSLKRVVDKKALLNEEQVYKLADLIGLATDELYTQQWKMRSGENKSFIFTLGVFTAVLDRELWKTTLYHDGGAFETIIHESKLLFLTEYLSILEQIISTQKTE